MQMMQTTEVLLPEQDDIQDISDQDFLSNFTTADELGTEDYNYTLELAKELFLDNTASTPICGGLQWKNSLAKGLRFRYISETKSKSFTGLKGTNNTSAIVEIEKFIPEVNLVIDLFTADHKDHFYSLYLIQKEKETNQHGCISDGKFLLDLTEKSKMYNLKLDFLGITKKKLNDAIPDIKQKFPEFSDSQAKEYYNRHKDVVCVRILLMPKILPTHICGVQLVSEPIKSQMSNEHTKISIQHIAPKMILDSTEELIVVLEKKITAKEFEAQLYSPEIFLSPPHIKKLTHTYTDYQTFVFAMPNLHCGSTFNVKFTLSCGELSDEKPIKIVAHQQENRKRKLAPENVLAPLKRQFCQNQLSSPNEANAALNIQTAQVESNRNEIEFDCAEELPPASDTGSSMTGRRVPDSGIDSHRQDSELDEEEVHEDGNKSSSEEEDSEDEDDGVSEDEGVIDGNSDIELEGPRRQRRSRKNAVEEIPLIIVPCKNQITNIMNLSHKDEETRKILSEVARIGHDFAFGKKPDEIFSRISAQLPVVFTLQDDVGDTPLNNAILKGKVSHAVRILDIARRHCSWSLDLVNTSGHTALILAPACDVPATFVKDLLAAGCRLDRWDDSDKNAVNYAIDYCRTDILKVLLDHVCRMNHDTGVSVLRRRENAYLSVLHHAVMSDFVEGLALLMDAKLRDCLDVNETTLMGEQTPLHLAVSHSVSIETFRLLLAHRDTEVNARAENGKTVLEYAREANLSQDIIELLVDNGAESESLTINTDDSPMTIDIDQNNSSVGATPLNTPEEEMDEDDEVDQELTENMQNLCVSGDLKAQLVDMLISNGLQVPDAFKIVRPAFKPFFKKEDIVMRDIMLRFNCLPDSLGALTVALENAGRSDLVTSIFRVASKFMV